MLASDFFRAKCLNAAIGIEQGDGCEYFSCFCKKYKDDPDRKQCDITSLGGGYENKRCLFTLNGPIWIRVNKYKCNVHKESIDFWDPDFVFGETDEWFVQTQKVFKESGGGVARIDDTFFSYDFVRFLWSKWRTNTSVSGARRCIMQIWASKLINIFDDDEYEKLKIIFKCNGNAEVFEKMVDLLLPAVKTILSIITGLGWELVKDLKSELEDVIASMGFRWVGWDGTWNVVKGIMLFIGIFTRIAALTVKTEWGHHIAWEPLPNCSESYKYIVPVLARLVKKSLVLGPVRTDQKDFMFCCDSAEHFKNIGIKVFKYIRKKLNGGRRYLPNQARSYNYDLVQLGRDAMVSQDIWHSWHRLWTDHVLLKSDPEFALAKYDLGHLLMGVREPGQPIILDGKLTGDEWYEGWFWEKFESDTEQYQFELDMSETISGMVHFRRQYNEGSIIRNEAIQQLKAMEKFAQVLDVIREILKVVHWFFLLSLFARWAWIDGDVNTNWKYGDNKIFVPVYHTTNDFKQGKSRRARMSKYFVSVTVIETILCILRWPITKLPQYGYPTIEHYRARKIAYFDFWSLPHHFSFQQRADSNDQTIAWCVINEQSKKATDRIKLATSNSRTYYEFNNTLFKLLVSGTQGIEWTHGKANIILCHQAPRSYLYMNIELMSTMIHYNAQHYEYLFINVKHEQWPIDIQVRLQRIYTDYKTMYYKFKKLRSHPKNPCFRIYNKATIAKEYMSKYVDSLNLPKIHPKWNRKNGVYDRLLLEILLVNVKLKRVKIKINRRNRLTQDPLSQLSYVNDDDSDDDGDDDDESNHFEVPTNIEQREEEYRLCAEVMKYGDKRFKKWPYNDNLELRQLATSNRNTQSSRQIKRGNVAVDGCDEETVDDIVKKLRITDLTKFELEPIPNIVVDEAVRLMRIFTKRTICNRIQSFCYELARCHNGRLLVACAFLSYFCLLHYTEMFKCLWIM